MHGKRYRKKLDILFVIDRSDSMGPYMETLNKCLKKMVRQMKESDSLSGVNVFVTILSFGDTVTKNVWFLPLEKVTDFRTNIRFRRGGTNPAPALELAFETSKKRYEKWRHGGWESFHPLLYFLTDGYPCSAKRLKEEKEQETAMRQAAFEKIAEEIQSAEQNKKITVMCGGFPLIEISHQEQTGNKMSEKDRTNLIDTVATNLMSLTSRENTLIFNGDNEETITEQMETFFKKLYDHTLISIIECGEIDNNENKFCGDAAKYDNIVTSVGEFTSKNPPVPPQQGTLT